MTWHTKEKIYMLGKSGTESPTLFLSALPNTYLPPHWDKKGQNICATRAMPATKVSTSCRVL